MPCWDRRSQLCKYSAAQLEYKCRLSEFQLGNSLDESYSEYGSDLPRGWFGFQYAPRICAPPRRPTDNSPNSKFGRFHCYYDFGKHWNQPIRVCIYFNSSTPVIIYLLVVVPKWFQRVFVFNIFPIESTFILPHYIQILFQTILNLNFLHFLRILWINLNIRARTDNIGPNKYSYYLV